MRAQRRQMGKPALRLPRVLPHKTTETPGLVAVVQMRLVAQIICAVAAMFCQAVAKRGRQEAGSTAETLTREYVVVRQEELLVFKAMPPHHLLHSSTNRTGRLLENLLGIQDLCSHPAKGKPPTLARQ
jgi:hypothetical protein